jgi:5-methylcytosine-specific restriction enzyme A
MVVAPKTFRPPWQSSPEALQYQRQAHDVRRGSARARGYTTKWDKARATWFRRSPLCVCCEANGVVHQASVLDHVIPHKGDQSLFWNTANWQGLCEWCDKNIKRSIENKWLIGAVPEAELSLNRRISGWLHPADRVRA